MRGRGEFDRIENKGIDPFITLVHGVVDIWSDPRSNLGLICIT